MREFMENNIIKWLKARSTQEKWMLALIAMLLVGIVVRWAWVSSEVAGAFRERFTAPAEQVEPTNADPAEQVDSLPKE